VRLKDYTCICRLPQRLDLAEILLCGPQLVPDSRQLVLYFLLGTFIVRLPVYSTSQMNQRCKSEKGLI